MLTYFQVKITIHLLNHIYIFNDKAPVISLWILSGCGQIVLTQIPS